MITTRFGYKNREKDSKQREDNTDRIDIDETRDKQPIIFYAFCASHQITQFLLHFSLSIELHDWNKGVEHLEGAGLLNLDSLAGLAR